MSKRKGKDRAGKETSHALYANHYRVGHNAYEFVIDFGQWYEGDAEAQFHARIVTSPRYAKELCNILTRSIAAYEQRFGTVREEE